MMKKGKPLDESTSGNQSDSHSAKQSTNKEVRNKRNRNLMDVFIALILSQSYKDDKKSQPVVPSRGKKGKSKKIKEKYADQDEEERELRMELLGVRFEIAICNPVINCVSN
jgi:hypothetical protein